MIRAARILVTDGDERASLAVVRSLGRAGHAVYVSASGRRSLAGGSRWASNEWQVPDPLADASGFVEAIDRIARTQEIAVIVPISEASILAVHDHGRELAAHVMAPQAAAFEVVRDKERLLRTAGALSIAVPAQVVVAPDMRGGAFDLGEVRPPFVVKPSRSVSGSGRARLKLGVYHAATEAELVRQLASLPVQAFPVLIQERIVGTGEGVFLLLHYGEPRAVFSHRRIREKPHAGGVSVCCESIPADPELVRQATALLKAFDWEGAAMVEFKRDARTGVPYLMEVNARFWGSIQLAIDSGVDFPLLAFEAWRFGVTDHVTSYEVGVRSRWWWGEIDHLIGRLLRSPERLALTGEHPGRLRTLLGVLSFVPGRDRFDVLRFEDPRPFVRETGKWIRSVMRAAAPGPSDGR